MSDFLKEAMAVGDDGVIEGGGGEGTWWKPEEGDIIGGPLVKGYYQTGDYGISPVLVIKDVASDTVFNVGCSTKMLKEFVSDLAPGVDTNVVIQFVGKFPVTSNPERSFNRYIMRVEGDPQFGYWQDAFRAFQSKQQMVAGAVQERAQSFGPDTSPF